MTRNGMRSVSGRGQARGERTPLLRAHLQRAYGEDEGDDENRRRISQEERAMRAAALRREEEVVFGRWPWRIFNRHVSILMLAVGAGAESLTVVVVARGTRALLLLCRTLGLR